MSKELADKVDAIIEETLHLFATWEATPSCTSALSWPATTSYAGSSGERPGDLERKPIPVAVDIRDLGSHFSCGKRPTSKTLKDRVRAALPIAKRIGYMRLTTARRLRMLKIESLRESAVRCRGYPDAERRGLQAADSRH